MPLPRPTIVIFDMDGTLVRHLNPRLLHLLEVADDTTYRLRNFFGKIGERLHLTRPLRTRRSTRKPRLIVHRVLHKLRRKPVEQIVEPCPGIIDLLELFQTHQIPVGLISNGLGAGYGHEILEKFELQSLLSTAVFREDTQKSKPDPEPIMTALARIKPNLGAEDVIWYVGDRAKDVAAALSASLRVQARVVPVGYGYHAALALFERDLGPDHLVLSYQDWYPVVEDILGPGPTANVA